MSCSKAVESSNIMRYASPCTIHVMLRSIGGKGGFGAMLRAQARQKGAKATTDFGACRDLNGRRLRHVNDEIRLQKWQRRQDMIAERKRNGLPFDDLLEEEASQSGIKGWYLAAPSWAEGIKKGKMNRYSNKKTG